MIQSMEITVFAILIGIIIFQEFLQFRVRKAHERDIRDLLNRIMARTLPEYLEAAAKLNKEAMKVVSVEELKREIMPPEPEQGFEV
jgi:hypothetical protein